MFLQKVQSFFVHDLIAQPGKSGFVSKNFADLFRRLVGFNGDPLDFPTQVEAAFIDGRKIDLSNRQTRLRDKYREKYRRK